MPIRSEEMKYLQSLQLYAFATVRRERRFTGARSVSLAYRNDIDGLRAIAVLAVMANHFAERVLPSGYLGVDVFFVISGFVITRSLDQHDGERLGRFLLAFYARRVKRLLPALVVCVAATALLISLLDPDPGMTLRAGAFALFGLSNYAMLQAGADYFSPSSDLNGLLHTWSLGVEEQFYLIFPLVGWLAYFRRPTVRRKAVYLGLFSLLATASLVDWYRMVGIDPMRAFFLTYLRFWELALGCLIAVLPTAREQIGGSPARAVQLGAIVLLLAVLILPGRLEQFATPCAVALAGLAIWSGNCGGAADRMLSSRASGWVGLRSYSIYLWHWPVIVFSRWTVGIHAWSWPFQVALILFLATLSYAWIETPLRRRAWTGRAWADLGLGMTGAALGAALILLLAFPLHDRLFIGERAPLAQRDAESLLENHVVAGVPGIWHGPDCILRNASEATKTISAGRCTLGLPASARRRILVVGNSHAAAYVGAFDRLVRDDDLAVTLTSSFGAAPLPDMPLNPEWRASSDHYWKSVVPALERNLRPGDMVMLISDISWLSPSPWAAEPKGDGPAKLRNALETAAHQLAQRGLVLAVVDGIPFVRDAGCTPDATLAQWYNFGAQTCTYYTRTETRERRKGVRDVMEALDRQGVIRLIDVFDVFCPGRVCTYRAADGRMLYRDEHSHPSLEAMRLVGPVIERALLADRGSSGTAAGGKP